MNEPVKGWKTSEFWKAIAFSLTGLLVTLGVFTPEQSSDLVAAVEKFSGAIITAVSTGTYAISRGLAKSKKE